MIVPVRAEFKPGFTLDIIQPPHIPKKNLIANASISTDCDIPVRVAMNIKTGDVLVVCEPVTKIFPHNEDLSDSNVEKIKSNFEISALELGHLTEQKRKVAREFLQKHNGMFASGQSSGRTNIVRHRINTEDAQPICQAPRRLPFDKTRDSRRTGTKNVG